MEIISAILSLATLAAVIIIGLFYKHYLPSYLSKKGANLATKEDFRQVLEQVKRTTEVTKTIESKVSQGQWVGQSELEYRKEQLADFYGPIYARLKLSKKLYRLWMDKQLEEISQDIMAMFRDNNKAIVSILINKAHLIDEGHIPEVFTRFMTSTTIWNYYTARPGKTYIEKHVEDLGEAKWPEEFESYIFAKTEELKGRLDDLHRAHRITL